MSTRKKKKKTPEELDREARAAVAAFARTSGMGEGSSMSPEDAEETMRLLRKQYTEDCEAIHQVNDNGSIDCPKSRKEARKKQRKFHSDKNIGCTEYAEKLFKKYRNTCYGSGDNPKRKWDMNEKEWRNLKYTDFYTTTGETKEHVPAVEHPKQPTTIVVPDTKKRGNWQKKINDLIEFSGNKTREDPKNKRTPVDDKLESTLKKSHRKYKNLKIVSVQPRQDCLFISFQIFIEQLYPLSTITLEKLRSIIVDYNITDGWDGVKDYIILENDRLSQEKEKIEEESERLKERMRGEGVEEKKETVGKKWKCQTCTFKENKPIAPVCKICGKPRFKIKEISVDEEKHKEIYENRMKFKAGNVGGSSFGGIPEIKAFKNIFSMHEVIGEIKIQAITINNGEVGDYSRYEDSFDDFSLDTVRHEWEKNNNVFTLLLNERHWMPIEKSSNTEIETNTETKETNVKPNLEKYNKLCVCNIPQKGGRKTRRRKPRIKTRRKRTRKKKSLKGGGNWVINDNKKDDKCPLCWEELTDGNLVYTLDCGHQFHNKCLYANIKYKKDFNNEAELLCSLCDIKWKETEEIDIESVEENFFSAAGLQELSSWPYVGTKKEADQGERKKGERKEQKKSHSKRQTRRPWRGGRRHTSRKKRKRQRRKTRRIKRKTRKH